jgi:hypothetical protein
MSEENGEYEPRRLEGTMQKPEESSTRRKTEHVFTITITAARVLGWSMFCFGIVVLTASMAYASAALAFIGLGLLFWGAIITYIQTGDYVKETLLSASVLPSLETLSQIIKELDYKGTAVYLPSKYLKDSETKVYVAKQKNTVVPTVEQIQARQNSLFIDKPKGILVTAPGRGLVRLLEKTLKGSFTEIEMQDLPEKLQKMLIKDLEIAQNLEFRVDKSTICVGIRSLAYKSLLKEIANSSSINISLGCPISSALACILADATDKPTTIAKWQTSDDYKTLQLEYFLLEE